MWSTTQRAIKQTHEPIDKWQIRMMFGRTDMDPKRNGITRRLFLYK